MKLDREKELMTALELMKLAEQKMTNIAFLYEKLKDSSIGLMKFDGEVISSIEEYLDSYKEFKSALILSNQNRDEGPINPPIYDPSAEL